MVWFYAGIWGSAPAGAATLTVGVGQTYATIGDAVAVAVKDDVVEIYEGQYVEDVVVPVRLTLRGVGNPTIIATGTANHVLELLRSATIEGLTVDGAGVARGIETETDLVLTDVTVINGVATPTGLGFVLFDGGGLEVRSLDATLAISGCTFVGNTANNAGGAIFADVTDLSIVDSTFEGNVAVNDGGAVVIYSPTRVEVRGSTFEDNAVTNLAPSGNGGAINLFFGPTVDGADAFEDNVFVGNTAGSGGALAAFDFKLNKNTIVGFDVVNNLFADNGAAFDGGAVHLSSTGFVQPASKAWTATFDQNSFVGNVAAGEGAVLWSGSKVKNITVQNLIAFNQGAPAVHRTTALGSTDYNLYFDNAGGDLGGLAIYGPNDLVGVDPTVTAYSADGDPTNDDLTPLPGSPLIDGGDPIQFDPDGSRADIGWLGY